MRLAVDLSNLSVGGGATHIRNVLSRVPPGSRFQEIYAFGKANVAEVLAGCDGRVRPVPVPLLDSGRWRAASLAAYPAYAMATLRIDFWRRRVLPRRLRELGADVLFAPGCLVPPTSGAARVVTMCRNMLPFDAGERRRFGLGVQRLKFELLRRRQIDSFRRADRVVFVSQYARDVLCALEPRLRERSAVIPHGVDDAFRRAPRETPAARRLLYVSPVAEWKHQWHVVDALARLRSAGLDDLRLELVGWVHPRSGRRLASALRRAGLGDRVEIAGALPADRVRARYHAADVFVFASSCENCPNILLEAMAAGLPIACSDRRPMPDFAGPGAVYFDPESPASIAAALERLLTEPALRRRLAQTAYERSLAYDWSGCAKATFDVLEGR